VIRRILALAWLNALQVLRNPAELVGVVGLPIVLTLLFGSAFAGQGDEPLRVLFVDEDGSTYAAQVGALIDDEDSFVIDPVSRDEAERRISEGEAGVAVLVPDGFGADLETGAAEIQVMRDPASESAYAVLTVVQGIALRMSGNVAAADIVLGAAPPGSVEFAAVYDRADSRWEPEPPVAARGQVVVASEVRGDSVLPDGVALSSIGFTVWFILFMTFGGAGGLLEERELGTMRRLLAAPVNRGTIIAGKVVGVVIAAAAQALMLVLAGALLFGVPWGRDPLAVALVLGSYVFAGTGLAVLVSGLVRTRDQLGGLAPLISTGLAMLGGSLWPVDITGPFMQLVAKLTPTGWAVSGLTDVVVRNQGIGAALLPTAVLLAFATVTLALGIRTLKLE
jgi:ABC-2 type transport system permease protein